MKLPSTPLIIQYGCRRNGAMKQVDTKSIIDRHGTTWPNGYQKEKENQKVVYIECSDYRNV